MANSKPSPQTNTTNSPLETEEGKHPFCTHECLLHFVHGNPLTHNRCPNITLHGDQKGGDTKIVRLLQEQLQTPQFRGNGLIPTGRAGRTSELYVVRLFRTGHTLLAKSYQQSDLQWLQNEAAVYERLRSLQGQAVPVFCGVIHLSHAMTTSRGTECHYLLLMSWAGTALGRRREDEPHDLAPRLQLRLLSAMTAIHKAQVVHGDPERRNIVFDETSSRVMVVDFERSRMYDNRPPCNPEIPCQKKYKDKKRRMRICTYCRDSYIAAEALLVGSPSSSPEPACRKDVTFCDKT